MKFVYLIRNNNSQYKIGIAQNPNKRLSQLQTGNSDVLKIIETYKSKHARKIETTLHNKFSYLKCNGEWFNLSVNDEINFITYCQKINDLIDILKKTNNHFI